MLKKTDLKISEYKHELTQNDFTIDKSNIFNDKYIEYYFQKHYKNIKASLDLYNDYDPSFMSIEPSNKNNQSLTKMFTIANNNDIFPIYFVISLFQKVESPEELWIRNIINNSKNNIRIFCDDGMINMSRSLLSQQSSVMNEMLNNYLYNDLRLKDVKIDVLKFVDQKLNFNSKYFDETLIDFEKSKLFFIKS